MRAFVDSSFLIGLFAGESLQSYDSFFRELGALDTQAAIYVSAITWVEFHSAIWKKYRTRELDLAAADKMIRLIHSKYKSFNEIHINPWILMSAAAKLTPYRDKGLRTLDSIQLVSAVAVRSSIDVFCSTDKVLSACAQAEGLYVWPS